MSFPARSRYTLSRPVRDAVRDRIIRPGTTFLDYGCGKGDDVRILRKLGYQASGWDPQFYPSPPPQAAQVVNFGYVLNVIADPSERAESLNRAYQLATEVLVVSAYVHNGCATKTKTALPFGDGHVTGRGHFQKLFYHKELGKYIEACIGVKPKSADFGVFYICREPGGPPSKMNEPVFGTGRESLLVEFAASYERPLGKLLRREMNDWQKRALSTEFDSYEQLCSDAAELLSSGVEGGANRAYRSAHFGKRTREALYVHRSSLEHLPLHLKLIIAKGLQIAERSAQPLSWELVKIRVDCQSISFLNAEPFETHDYPALLGSTHVNLLNGSATVRKESATNPSIYHRKDLFLHPTHPWLSSFRELALADERAGLLNRPDIGRRLRWQRIQSEHGSAATEATPE